MITLICGKQTLECSDEGAAAILHIQSVMKATKWELPSQYQINEDGIIIRTDKGISKRQTTKKRDRQSDSSPEPTEVSHRDGTTEERAIEL